MTLERGRLGRGSLGGAGSQRAACADVAIIKHRSINIDIYIYIYIYAHICVEKSLKRSLV